jgi:hypothetical protein
MNDSTTINPLFSPQQQGTPVDLLPSEESAVKLWRSRIKAAKLFFETDYKRMRENMEFAAGIQWSSQDSIDDVEDRYIANFITNHCNQKVASLYAKDPKCEARRRKRLDFAIWDGSIEQEWSANMTMQGALFAGAMTPQAVQASQLLQDIAQGKQWQALCDKVGKTLEILYQYQCDTQSPTFKYQMKQLVRRVVTCGVGFVRLNYVNQHGNVLSSSLTDDSFSSTIKHIQAITAGIQDDNIQESDPRVEQLRLLTDSLQSSVKQGDMTNIEERLEFDFPSACSVIVDPRCKSLKGFIGANWVAQEYILSLDDANSYFELRGDNRITATGELVVLAEDGKEVPRPDVNQPPDLQKAPLGCFWEVFDLTTKSSFFICDGWKNYVSSPTPLDPSINQFWPIMALTFNDVEVEPGQKVHIYPPSDVQLLKPMQKERNRSRNELKEHRKVNRPFFWGLSNTVEKEDLEKFANHETGEFIQLKSTPMGANGAQNVADAIGKWVGTPIDPSVYEIKSLDDDTNQAVGSNSIQQQQPIRHVAATPAVIQEQARISGVSSNVDDLDDLLSCMAQAAGEMMLKKFQPQTVQRIVGRGAAFPDQKREDFLNEVFLDIIAASSGRPNKAVDVQNAMQLGPLMLQAGANPWPLIQYYAKVLDSNLNPADFAPQTPMQQPQGNSQPQQKQGLPGQHPNAPHPGVVGQQLGGQPALGMQGGAH